VTESDFLSSYDPNAFERPSVTVDLVLMTISEGALRVLLTERSQQPFAGMWGLPGTFVRMEEALNEAAQRVLHEKAGLSPTFLEQLYTFGAVDRDPRMRIISVAYFALLPASAFEAVINDERDLAFIGRGPEGTATVDREGSPIELPFDHGLIIKTAVERLRAKLDWSDVAFALLPEEFTLRELQHVHEVIRGKQLNKPSFRTRMLTTGRLEPTGRRESGGAFRPAELYRVREPA
jgi:8-oxo-dGTP diphosphatase